MTGLVIVTRGATCAKRGCERRGTYSHPHSASGGTAHHTTRFASRFVSVRGFLGDPRFKPSKQSFRGIAQGFHSNSPFLGRCSFQGHLTTRGHPQSWRSHPQTRTGRPKCQT